MKRMLPVLLIAAALVGYVVGYASKAAPQPILSGHFDDFSMVPSANAQENKTEVCPSASIPLENRRLRRTHR